MVEHFKNIENQNINLFKEFEIAHIRKEGNFLATYTSLEKLVLGPQETRIKDNLEYYRQELRKSAVDGKRGDDGLIDNTDLYTRNKITPSGSQTEMSSKREDLIIYERLCRGEIRAQVSAINLCIRESNILIL